MHADDSEQTITHDVGLVSTYKNVSNKCLFGAATLQKKTPKLKIILIYYSIYSILSLYIIYPLLSKYYATM